MTMLLVTHMNDSKKQSLLRQIAAISAMEPGKLSTYAFKERSGAAGPYHKLQHWDQGKNKTRYVPAEALPQIQAAVAGYQQYLQLTTQYANLVIQETREAIADSKKNQTRRGSSSPKKKNFNS